MLTLASKACPCERVDHIDLVDAERRDLVEAAGHRGRREKRIGRVQNRVRDRDPQIEDPGGGVRVPEVDDPRDAAGAATRSGDEDVVVVDIAVDDLRSESQEVGLVRAERLQNAPDEVEPLGVEELEVALHHLAGPSQRPVEVDACRGMVGVRSESAVQLREPTTKVDQEVGRAGSDVREDAAGEVLQNANAVDATLRVFVALQMLARSGGYQSRYETSRPLGEVEHQLRFDPENLVGLLRRADFHHVPAAISGIEDEVAISVTGERCERAVEAEVISYGRDRFVRTELCSTLNLDHLGR